MKKGKINYGLRFILFLSGIILTSCTGLYTATSGSYISDKNIQNAKTPKVEQLHALDCPWNGNYVIKNKDHYKSYGPDYALSENKKLEKVF